MGRATTRIEVPDLAIEPAPTLPERADEPIEDDDLGDLGVLSDASYADVVWYFWRMPADGNTRGGVKYSAKFTGPLDLEEVRKSVGGGWFRVGGYRRNGNRLSMFFNRKVELEGPPKVWSPPPAEPASPPVEKQDPPASELAALRGDIRELTRAILDQRQAPPAPAPVAASGAAGLSVKDVLELMHQFQPPTPPAPEREMVSGMIDMLKQGIALGQGKDPEGESSPWPGIIEKAAPLLERILMARSVPRRAPSHQGPPAPPPQPPPPASGSSVEVLERDENPRMSALVEALSSAIEQETDPESLAITAETLLKPLELTMLRTAGVDGLLSELVQFRERFPVFVTPEARPYLEAFLSELNTSESSEQ